MKRANTADLKTLFELLDSDAPHLRAVCRGLALSAELGPDRAAVLLGRHVRPGSKEELTDLIRLLEREAPDIVSVGHWLVGHSDQMTAVRVELQLDVLLAADIDAWEHPTQILERPRPDFAQMLVACAARRKGAAGEEGEMLRRIEEKLERAVRIAESARRRRETMQRGRKRRKRPAGD